MDFFEHYNSIFKEQWSSLLEGLKAPAQKVSLNLIGATGEETGVDRAVPVYSLDAASIAPLFLTPLREGIRALDMCAAPGGKSLVLLQKLRGNVDLLASDLSMNRVSRLKKVLMDHTPAEWHKNIKVFCRDGNQFGLREKDSYDFVMLDAPCSSERHVLSSKKDLDDWSLKRIRGLKMRQHSLLCSALAAVKPGGYVLYSTCALISDENDQIIERLHESREGQFEVVTHAAAIETAFDDAHDNSTDDPSCNVNVDAMSGVKQSAGKQNNFNFKKLKKEFEDQYDLKIEATKYGHQILPFINKKTGEAPGPLYWCLLKKKEIV